MAERAAQTGDNPASWHEERRELVRQLSHKAQQYDLLVEKFLVLQEQRDLAMAQSDRLGKTKDKLISENQKLQLQLARQINRNKELSMTPWEKFKRCAPFFEMEFRQGPVIER